MDERQALLAVSRPSNTNASLAHTHKNRGMQHTLDAVEDAAGPPVIVILHHVDDVALSQRKLVGVLCNS